MINSTLCYLEKDEKYLMLLRNKKKNDPNSNKYIGVGGKLEEKESPIDCAKREIFEETGLIAQALDYRAVITFVSDKYPTEQMHLFTCKDFTGIQKQCDEGDLFWIDKAEVLKLPLWEGDKVFLKLMEEKSDFFSLKLVYLGDSLKESYLNGEKL